MVVTISAFGGHGAGVSWRRLEKRTPAPRRLVYFVIWVESESEALL